MSVERLLAGLECGFVDRSINAESDFIPQFLTNDYSRNEKVITTIKHEMNSCNEFWFSVAFVTDDGVQSLLTEFKRLEEDKIKGKILVSQYQNFTQPKALEKLLTFSNIELRIVTEEQMKMHSKCYIFRKGDNYDLIIGSSNLTNSALCSNGEWNLKVNSSNSGEVISTVLKEFEKVFKHATVINDRWLGEYDLIYNELKEFRYAVKTRAPIPLHTGEDNRIVPNKMQCAALVELEKMRNEGKKRALIISSTGSGKTYLSAFDAKKYNGKYLYIVHRKPILEKSMKSFRNVLGPEALIEKYDPQKNNLGAQYLFSTIQTISKDEVLDSIPREQFDYIVIDEVHHAGADTYQKVLKHFTPKFLMGMTATPDTKKYDIYQLFEYNIAYEIRLKDALDLNLVCPFHYFGIAELEIDDIVYEDKSTFNKVDLDQRIDHVIKYAKYYGYSGKRVKGIVFCSGLKSAETFSSMFNKRGYNTAWVSGEMKEEYVQTQIERLEADEGYTLDYIFTADLFNEGVDIPSVNQIIMLRPTQSPVVYIQQLGRGLRLHRDKDYVVILDFIGNFENNYNIPLALSDDHTYNRAETRRFVESGDSIIPGNSTISFNKEAKKRILKSIDNTSFGNKQTIFDEYVILKKKLGKIPSLVDFKKHGSIDPTTLISEYDSYYKFLSSREKDYKIRFSEKQIAVLKYLSKLIIPGKRIFEIEVLELINSNVPDIQKAILERYNTHNPHLPEVLISLYDGSFYSTSVKLIQEGRISQEYLDMLSDGCFRNHILDLIEVGKLNNEEYYSKTYEDTDFVLCRQYTYTDVCRLLNWKKDINGQNVGGYKHDARTNTFPIFVNYKKGENVRKSIRYKDYFENRRTIICESKNRETVGSKNITRIQDSDKTHTTLHLFVRKNTTDDGAKEFFYLGKIKYESVTDTSKPCKIRYKLKNEVRSDIYEYLTN